VNRESIREALLDRLGLVAGADSNSSNDALASDAVLNRLIGRALHEIEGAGGVNGWDWLRGEDTMALTAGVESYTFAAIATAASIAAPIRRIWPPVIEDTYRTVTERVGLRTLREYWDGTSAADRGRPAWCAIEASTLYLAPSPDAAYTIRFRYLTSEPDLTADTGAGSTPLMPDAFQDMLVEKAAVLWLRRAQNAAMAAVAQAAYQGLLRDAIQFQRSAGGPSRVTVSDVW
jgi:hypothetical protein